MFELDNIMYSSICNNHDSGITGLLWATENNFIQVVEGPEEQAESLMGIIYSDRRHRDIKIVKSISAEGRDFGNWSMRLVTHDPYFKTYEDAMLVKLRKLDNDTSRLVEKIIKEL